MTTKTKAIIAAILTLLCAAFGWYVAYSDGDESTKPDTQAVIEAGKDVYDAATSDDATKTPTDADAVATDGE